MGLIAYAGKPSQGPRKKYPASLSREAKQRRDEDILRRHNAGVSHVLLAQEYGMTSTNVGRIVTEMGGAPRGRGKKK